MIAIPVIFAAVEPGSLQAEINYALTFVPTYAMVLVRVASMFLFSPLFGSGRVPRPVKAAIACVLAVCITPNVAPVVLPDNIYALVAGITAEMLFGLAMGMIMSLVFVAAQWAGEIIGQQLGFNLGEVFDPQFGAAGSVISDLLFMLTLVIFLCVGGHHAMLHGLYKSFQYLPLLSITTTNPAGGFELLTGLLLSCTVLVARLVAPTIVAMLLADVVLGFISKTLPQLNVMSAGMPIRSMLGMLVIAAGITYTNEVMRSEIVDSAFTVQKAWITPWTRSASSPSNNTSVPPGTRSAPSVISTAGGTANG